MDLTETSPIPDAALPVAAFRDHLRLSSGFADDTTQDALLLQYLRAAVALVEGRVGRALLQRGYLLRLSRWRDGQAERLPIAPVQAITGVTMIDREGTSQVIAPARYTLHADGARPHIRARGSLLPAIPTGGVVEIAFTAGFGPDWQDSPADLRQAVLLLAAQFYEGRDTGTAAGLDHGVAALLARWRDLRLGGGA